MKHIALFNGIGGFQLAASWVGWNNVAHVEIDQFCNRVVAYHFPNSQCFTDIKQFDGKPFRNTIDIISGGFPCQPYSAAGKRLGTADDRHLWPEMLRVVSEIHPGWVVGENVRGLTNWNGGLVFDQVQADLEAEGYEVLPFLLPACAVNAPHRRDRIWFIAYSGSKRTTKSSGWINESRELFQEAEWKENKQFSEFIGESRDATDSGLLRQEINEQQAARVEQQGERIIVESNWDTDEGFNDPDEHFTTHTDGLRRKQEYELQQSKLSIKLCKERNATNSACLRINREKKHENDCGQSREWRGCDVNNVGEVPGRKVIADTNIHIGCKRRMHSSRPEKTERHFSPCDTWQIRNDWSNFPTVSPICDRNDGLSDRLVNITFPKWRNESIKALGNSIVPQLAFEIFKAIDEFDKLK